MENLLIKKINLKRILLNNVYDFYILEKLINFLNRIIVMIVDFKSILKIAFQIQLKKINLNKIK